MCCWWCCRRCLECIHNIVPPLSLPFLRFSGLALPGGGGAAAAASPPVVSMASISVPSRAPSAAEDAENIRKAVQGWGTDEKALIEILGHRTAAQRAEIAVAYEGLYNEPIIDRLHSELSGDFRSAMMLWTVDPAARDAKLAHKAMKKQGERYVWVLIEVACASAPDHLVAVRKAYREAYSASLEEDVAACPLYKDPLLKQFLVRLVSSYRYSGELVDDELARAEAAELHDAVVARKQPLHGDVVRVVSSRSKAQLKATFERYRLDHGKAVDEVLEERRSDQLAAVLKTAVWCLTSPEKHFAEVIRSSIVGLGTDEESLTRAIVSRAEIDMKKVKEEYRARYRTTVTSDVNGDTSGYYNVILLTLVGPE
ncbi:annexin-like protein RJ4 [Zea mays]|uniref:Annexin n=1 Tax=Zea mays TaxID=4577 RepID=B4FZ06_MAIZE|nr:annexin-like protein RJ4 [Zea mays]ACF87349.1 unknown [Zea mays]AQK85548.1 Annexin [Zea mays]|eukprot:NP_001141942.1 annexin-like protein RJ4 [Zea mays]